jgi:phage terminase small subunit
MTESSAKTSIVPKIVLKLPKRPRRSEWRAPRHLSAESRKLFRWVTQTYQLELDAVRVLTVVCESWDDKERARVAIAEHGQTYTDRLGNERQRPEVGIQRSAERIFLRAVRELNLDLPPAESRPPAALLRSASRR